MWSLCLILPLLVMEIRAAKVQLPVQLQQSSSSLVEQLRNEGRVHLSFKRYEEAADCYAAIIQKLEGVGGSEAGELMRRCGLTLAECEIKLGNLYDAIARCTEVINESPDDASLQQTLGKAFYRRGVSFHRLDMLKFAYVDMLQASRYLPEDAKVASTILTLEESLNTTASELKAIEEELQDAVEEATLKFPRRQFTKKELRNIINNGALEPEDGQGALPDFMNSLGQFGDAGAASSPFDLQSLFRGAGDLGASPLGGLGGLSGILSSVMEPANMKNYMEMFSAVNSVRLHVGSFIKALKANQQIVLLVLTVVWLIRIFTSP